MGPPLWPSRLKVVITSVATASFGFGLFTFLAQASVSELDLQHPVDADVFCYNTSRFANRSSHRCLPSVAKSCRLSWVPAEPLVLLIPTRNNNFPRSIVVAYLLWPFLVFVVSLILVCAVMVHDLSLLQRERCKEVYNLKKARDVFPRCFSFLWKVAMCCDRASWLRGKSCLL